MEGYALFALLFVFVSNFLEEFYFKKKNIFKFNDFNFFTILIFNGRNLIRINKEIMFINTI